MGHENFLHFASISVFFFLALGCHPFQPIIPFLPFPLPLTLSFFLSLHPFLLTYLLLMAVLYLPIYPFGWKKNYQTSFQC